MIPASCFCHPLDVIRIQMQVDSEGGAKRMYKGTFDCATQLYRRGGFSVLYAGITAAWLRQITYSATRMGVYSYLLDKIQRANDGGRICSFRRAHIQLDLF